MSNGLYRRQIVLQEPDSGLDVFLKEVSKYFSPEYQAMQREQERADARLELQKRKFDTEERRYQDSLEQQDFLRNLSINQEQRNKEIFEMQKDANMRSKVSSNISSITDGYNAKDFANMNPDSLIVDIADPKERMMAKRQLMSLQSRGASNLARAEAFAERYNQNPLNQDTPMSSDDAISFIENPQLYKEFLANSFMNKRGDLTEQEVAQINFHSGRIAQFEKRATSLLEKIAGTGSDEDKELLARVDNVDTEIANSYGIINRLLGDSGMNMGFEVDPFAQPRERDAFEIADLTDDTEDLASYENLFSDDEQIAENAVETAIQFANDDSDVSIQSPQDLSNLLASEDTAPRVLDEDRIDDYNPSDPRLTEESPVPPEFLARAEEPVEEEQQKTMADRLVDRLNVAGATEREAPSIEPVQSELFGDVRPTLDTGLRRPDGSFINVESVTSSTRKILKKIERLKKRYNKLEGNSKLILARAITKEQDKLREIRPYMSSQGNFSNKKFNESFYRALSQQTKIPIQELKSLILSNAEYNI